MLPSLSIAFTAFIVTLLLIPLVKRAARRFHLLDIPDGRRKLHAQTTPLGGGIAILAGILGALAVAILFNSRFQREILTSRWEFIGLLSGVALLCGVGLLDDRFGLRGRQKLAGQFLATLCVAAFGIVIGSVQLFSWRVDLGLLSIPFTLFWFLGAINAFNLLDGIDGLAGSVGLILSLALAAMAALTGHPAEALIALALAGSLAAFLTFNFPPASIFLGDTGSTLIGLLLAVLAIRTSLKGPATVALAAPVAILAIPILDTGMAILRRRLTGRSIYETDRCHLHHCLMRRGCSGRTTLLWIGALSATTALGALLSIVQRSELLALGSVVMVVAVLVMTRLFGHSECRLLGQRVKHLVMSLVPTHQVRRAKDVPGGIRLHGDQEWDELWRMLVQYAEQFDLTAVRLSVNLPQVHESYHADWQRKGTAEDWWVWHTRIPLVYQGANIGRLELSGVASGESQLTWMAELIEGLLPFHTMLKDLVEQLLDSADSEPSRDVPAPENVTEECPTAPAVAT